jgi:hypothetical protein
VNVRICESNELYPCSHNVLSSSTCARLSVIRFIHHLGWGVDVSVDEGESGFTTTGKILHQFKLGVLKVIQEDQVHSSGRLHSLRSKLRRNSMPSPVPAPRHIAASDSPIHRT